MEQLGLDLEMLSHETFALARELANHNLESLDQTSVEFEHMRSHRLDRSWRLNEHSGLFFRVESGPNTYCLRGFASHNLKQDFHLKLKAILQALKLNDWDEAPWQTFLTPNQAIADVLCDQMMNKRMPMAVDSLCNLSDPAMNWWFKRQSHSLTLYTGAHKGFDNSGFLSLGPLGDANLAQRRWRRFMDALGTKLIQWGVNGFQVQPHQMVWEFSCEDSPLAIGLEQWLIKGVELTEEFFPVGAEFKIAQLYLREVAYGRRLWLLIDEHLGQLKAP